jgi:hypothetical protein
MSLLLMKTATPCLMLTAFRSSTKVSRLSGSLSRKKIAGSLLASSDWYVTRKAETGAEIPAAVATYRAAVRTTSGTREAEINACTTTEELAALLTNPAQVYDEATDSMVANTEPFITPFPEQD